MKRLLRTQISRTGNSGTIFMKAILTLLFPAALYAGQSISLTTTNASNSSIPAQPAANSWRVEFSIHDWDVGYSTGTHGLDGASVGMNVQFLNFGGGDLRLQLYSSSKGGGSVCTVNGLGPSGPGGGGSVYTNRFLTVRFQEDTAAKIDYCQAWDINGAAVITDPQSLIHPYTSTTGANSNGATVAGLGSGQNLDTAYFRIYTTTVPLTAVPPTTAQDLSNCLVSWKFDLGNNTGSLTDSCSAGPYDASMSSGGPSYVATPGQSLVVAQVCSIACTSMPQWTVAQPGAEPSWDYTGTNVAYSPYVDGRYSYSQIDSSPTCSTYAWTISGPGTPALSSPAASNTVVTGASSFGQYAPSLTCTDAAANTGSVTAAIGAVAQNAQGIVQTGSASADFLFGPMIAFGQNPWGYQDYWQLHASAIREQNYISEGWIQGVSNQPQWEYTGAGTVAYYWNCVGAQYYCNSTLYSGTTVGSTSTGASTITVSSIVGLDLSAFPTHIILAAGTSPTEVRICSNASTTLNVCYDGWGNTPSQTFANGTAVIQAKVTGTGTHFLTDATAPLCPLGAGLPGPSEYSTGTITLTAGSATVTGSGTAWTSALIGSYIQVAATHSSTAFTFIAVVQAVGSGTSITLSRVYPADADTTSGLSYHIMAASRTIVLRYPHLVDNTGNGEVMFGNPGGCESETAAYTNPIYAGNTFATGHDLSNDGTPYTGEAYSVTDTTGWVNQNGAVGGISFYGESLSHRSLYLRSGLTAPQTAANYISDFWIKSPWGNRDINGISPLWLGGEAIGSFTSAILTGRVSWSDLRSYANSGVQMAQGFAINGCNGYDDTRDSGYAYTWLILGAIYDPDTTSTAAPGGIPWRTYWQSQLAQMQTNDTNCQNQTVSSGNSFANGFYWNNSSAVLTMTNGSANATGTGIASGLCQGTAQGTATVTSGSDAIAIVTGSIPMGTTGLILTGTSGGGASVLIQNTPFDGSVTLGELWPGDSGTVSWMSTAIPGYPQQGVGTAQMMTIATGHDDLTNLAKSWACVWNSSSSITLNRNWDGVSSDAMHVYYPYTSNLAGYGQQPFMLGIKSLGENWLATQTLPALAAYVAPYQSFTANSTSWIWNTGMDPQLLTTNYGRIFQQCEPTNTSPMGTTFQYRASGCTYGLDPTAMYLGREQNAEAGDALAIYYANNSNPSNKTQADEYYGALWGWCPWTTGGVYCDANATAANANGSNLADSSFDQGKWFGFFAGIGESYRWPAQRLLSAAPVVPVVIGRGGSLGGGSGIGR